MQFNFKNYQSKKVVTYIKKNFLIFSIGANQNSKNWLLIEQNMQKLNFKYYKTYNNVGRKIIKNSIYKNFKHTLYSTFFFIKKKNKNTIKKNDITTLHFSLFPIINFKLNKKIYSIKQCEKISSFNYKKNVLILLQFIVTNSKLYYSLKK